MYCYKKCTANIKRLKITALDRAIFRPLPPHPSSPQKNMQ